MDGHKYPVVMNTQRISLEEAPLHCLLQTMLQKDVICDSNVENLIVFGTVVLHAVYFISF